MSPVKLRTKIFGGFIFLLLLTTAMAFLGWHNLRVLVTEVEHRDTLNLIQKDALEARRQEKNYVLRGGQEYLDAVDRLVQAIKDQVAAGGRAINDQAIRESFGKILESTGLYEAAFGRYVNAGRQTDKKDTPEQQSFLDQADKDMVSAARALLLEVDQALSVQKENMHSRVARATTLILGGAFLALIAGVLVSIYLARESHRGFEPDHLESRKRLGAGGCGLSPGVQRQPVPGRGFFPAGRIARGNHLLPGGVGGIGETKFHARRGVQSVGAPDPRENQGGA